MIGSMSARLSWVGPHRDRRVAIGAMRLSTDPLRDDDRAIAVLHAAFDAGVDLVDTADAYARDATEVGHNERLIARALSTWPGDRARVLVATKGGLTRPEGRWVPDGRARHLIAACHASRQALGVERIALYQLHAPDPRVSWLTSVRALAQLASERVIASVGLSNVTVGQIETALTVVDVATVQIELTPWSERAIGSGVVAFCADHDICVLGYRPLGGPQGAARIARDRLVRRLAETHDATPCEIVLAWMRGLAPHFVPVPGPTQPVTAHSCGRVQSITLTEQENDELDAHFPLGRLRRDRPVVGQVVVAPQTPADIVMVMGLPGAGKSTAANTLAAQGYERLNRDETGGPLASLIPMLTRRLDAGAERIVLDNTYLTRASRAAVIDAARSRGHAVRGVWLDTSLEDAQINAVWRMLRKYGRLLTPDELRVSRDPAVLSPSTQFRAQRELEPPVVAEGFSTIDTRPFARTPDEGLVQRAVIFWCDGVLRRSRSGATRPRDADDVEPLVSHRDVLSQYSRDGWRLLAMSWEPEVTEQGKPVEDVEEAFRRLRDALALDLDYMFCPHAAGPPVCWCRKPLPGLGVLMIQRHLLDPSRCIYVGTTTQDASFARRLGFGYCRAEEFFGEAPSSIAGPDYI
jgi:aryl-alcohol dehydrogenase-like predicted oxidoreductase/histidinol phosphatase-like enzyme/predicted kinase